MQKPSTEKLWEFDTDVQLSVQVRVADDTYDAGNYIIIRDDDSRGVIRVARHSTDELISVLEEARDYR